MQTEIDTKVPHTPVMSCKLPFIGNNMLVTHKTLLSCKLSCTLPTDKVQLPHTRVLSNISVERLCQVSFFILMHSLRVPHAYLKSYRPNFPSHLLCHVSSSHKCIFMVASHARVMSYGLLAHTYFHKFPTHVLPVPKSWKLLSLHPSVMSGKLSSHLLSRFRRPHICNVMVCG